jgi:hypothetical protein
MPNRRDQRKSKRVSALKPTWIRLKGQTFQVSNISNDGLGIIMKEDGPPFAIGERLAEIPIPLENGAVNVQGVVSHISYSEAGRICGIQFIFSGAEYDAVMRFKEERRQETTTREEK